MEQDFKARCPRQLLATHICARTLAVIDSTKADANIPNNTTAQMAFATMAVQARPRS